MSFRRLSTLLTGLTCSLLLVASPCGSAQDAAPVQVDPKALPLDQLVGDTIQLMRVENWAEALRYSQATVDVYSNNALSAFGPRFGGVYFRKGICELKLNKFDEAIKSFETCYKEFPNKKDTPSEMRNPNEKTCLIPWAEACMGKEEWQNALDLFEKYAKERDRERDDLPQGKIYVKRSICFFSLGQLAEGNENLETAIKNKERFRLPDATILGAFRYMVDAVIKSGNEQALLDFIAKNRGEIVFDPFDMYPFSSFFMKLASDAVKANMYRATYAIYQLVPSTDISLHDARAKLESLGPRAGIRTVGGGLLIKKQLEQGIKQLEEAERSPRAHEMAKLMTLAYIQQQYGNMRGAYAAYQQLELYYPKSEKREDNLYNLARLSFVIDQGSVNLDDANLFLKNYPASEKAPQIRRLMLASLFAQQQYEQCIAQASELMPTLKEGTPEHDIALHVLSGSYFYTGQFETAQPLLTKHVELYPKSDSKVAAAYFQASNAYRLGDLEKAVKLLSEFISKYPDPAVNTYLPFAFYDKATSHYYLDQNDEALATVDQLLEKFAGSRLADQASNLRGNILTGLEKPIEAEAAYKDGLRVAERANNPVVIGESLYNLMGGILAESDGKDAIERLDEAVQYADKFWKVCGEDSPWASSMAVRQLPVLEQAKRLDQALQILERSITRVANSDKIEQLESLQMLDAYTEYFLKQYETDKLKGADNLKDKYNELPGIPLGAKEVRALMLIQVISVYEEVSRKSKDRDEKVKADATIKVLFDQLKSKFKVDELTSSILAKVGNYLRTKSATPREALPLYNEIIKRKDTEFLHAALEGRADIYGQSTSPADLDKALADYKTILGDLKAKEKPTNQENNKIQTALFRTIDLLVTKQDYQQAREKSLAFLDKETGFPKSKYAGDVRLLLANAYEGLKMNEDAIEAYSKAAAENLGRIRVAVPATKRWMELLWERNNPGREPEPGKEGVLSDRQGAYNQGAKYVELTATFKERMTDEDLALWNELAELVKQFEANPKVKSLKQQEAEKQ